MKHISEPHRRGAIAWVGVSLVGLMGLVACSDDDDTKSAGLGGSGGTAGSGGTTAGAGGTTAGTGGTTAGTGGTTAGTGGTAGTTAGTGGTGGVGCEAPRDPTASKACITLAPQALTPGTDPDIDGQGVGIIQVYSTATPDAPGAPAALATLNITGAGGAELSLAALAERLEQVDGLPETVYIRAWFFDNPLALQLVTAGQAPLVWGVFLGGADLNQGLSTPMRLRAVSLTAGEATNLTIPMVGFRKLVVQLGAGNGYQFPDDGQGLISWGAFQQRGVSPDAAVFGLGRLPACVDMSTPQFVPGFVIAECPGGSCDNTYLAGRFDDYGYTLDPNAGLVLPIFSITANEEGDPPVLLLPTSNQINLSEPARYDLGLMASQFTHTVRQVAEPPASFSCPGTGGAGGTGGAAGAGGVGGAAGAAGVGGVGGAAGVAGNRVGAP